MMTMPQSAHRNVGFLPYLSANQVNTRAPATIPSVNTVCGVWASTPLSHTISYLNTKKLSVDMNLVTFSDGYIEILIKKPLLWL